MAKSFTAQIDAWAGKSEARMTAVFRSSAQAVANEVRQTVNEGGRMPIRTGNLRRSLMASTSAMPLIKSDAEFPDESSFELVIAGANIGETIYLGFQAAYARRMEYGFVGADSLGRNYNQEGFGFVAAAAGRWQDIVREQTALVKSRVNARGQS